MPRESSSSSSSSESDSSSSEAKPNFIPVSVERLSRNVTEEHIKQIFSHFGTVGSVFMKYGPQLNSYAVVHFFSKHEAEIAISYMNKGYIDGSQIIVQLELPKKKSRSPPHQKGRDHRQRKKYQRQRDYRRNKKNIKKHRSRRSRRSRSSSSSGVSSSQRSSDSNSS